MNHSELIFNQISEKLISEKKGVQKGKMMHAPALAYDGKVFAFFYKSGGMVFRFGKNYTNDKIELTPFNPFKNKGPLSGWYEIPFENHTYWEESCLTALQQIKH